MSATRLIVAAAGLNTTVQDTPGRIGYWMVGVPPSGAMDDRSLRLANRVVGNLPEAAGLECTVVGPTLHFTDVAVVAVGGAVGGMNHLLLPSVVGNGGLTAGAVDLDLLINKMMPLGA
ncbi:MAG: hypothetical protein AAGF02_16060, partial [Actinomycetota bacterium]